MPYNFQQLANFRLASGPHPRPNRRGALCLMEAATIAAGFEHRPIRSAGDLPDCFSRLLGSYAFVLNDKMDARTRRKLLMPFILRLAGTADSRAVEQARAEFIILQTLQRIVAAALEDHSDPWLARECRDIRQLDFRIPAFLRRIACTSHAVADVANAVRLYLAGGHHGIGGFCATAAWSAAASYRIVRQRGVARIWERAAGILDEAILLGRHDGIDDHAAAVERLERAVIPA